MKIRLSEQKKFREKNTPNILFVDRKSTATMGKPNIKLLVLIKTNMDSDFIKKHIF